MAQRSVRWQLMLALAVAFLAGLAMPFAPRIPGYAIGSALATLLLAAPSFRGALQWLGWKRASLLISILALFAYAIETIGLRTGFPYGAFTYGDALGFKVLGVTPLLLPFAYVPLVLGAVWIAWRAKHSWWRFTLVGTGSLLAFDFVLDPGAVALGFWTFAYPGIYYGVPVTNFAGWIFSGAIALLLAYVLLKDIRAKPPALVRTSAALSMALWSGVALAVHAWLPLIFGIVLTSALVSNNKK